MKKISFVLVLIVLVLSVYAILPAQAGYSCCGDTQQTNDRRYNGRNNNVEKYRDGENRNVVNVRKPPAQNNNSSASCH